MSAEALFAAAGAIALLLVASSIRRIEKRLDHIDELRVAESRQDAQHIAMSERLHVVEVDSRRWDEVIASLTDLSSQLARLVERVDRMAA